MAQALLGRRPPLSPATAVGWRAAALRGRSYPGLVPAAPDGRCAGDCLHGLSAAERELLDLFEGDSYVVGEVALAGGGSAGAYLWRDGAEVETADWDVNRFAAVHLTEFVRYCREWRAQARP